MNKKAVQAMQDFLEAVGVDLKASGMEKTPERVAGMYEYLFNGIGVSTDDVWGELFKVENEGIVAVRDIPFYSMCEHHLVPFFGKVSIAYKPHEGSIAGFSKFSRMVEIISHRPQLQERRSKLSAMVDRMPKQRAKSGFMSRCTEKSAIIDYEYANYDIGKAEEDLRNVSEEIARLQTALDVANTTGELEIEL